MKKLTACLLFSLYALFLFAQQETLSPLSFNPSLYYSTKKYTSNQHRYLIDKGNIIVSTDTLSIPFIDDFSRNTLRSHKWVENHITDTYYNVFGTCLGPEGVATISDTFMTTQSWSYSFDTLNDRLDSFPLAPINFTFFGPSTANCFTQTPQPFTYWPKYYTYTFDSTTGRPRDSVRVQGTIVNYAPVIYFSAAEPGTNWFDNYAYVNSTYPILPPTIGVATLDGLNEFGRPYNNTTSLTYGSADMLTIKPINLQGLAESDSVYLSFFYEAKGLGELPDVADSLLVEFRDNAGFWRTIWSMPGYSTSVTPPQTFKQVLVKVPDLAAPYNYFHSTFQFRFRNKASLYGNLDHWHIDYVKLDRNRTVTDTVIQDVAFVYPFPTLLKNYTQAPADQLDGAGDLVDTIRLLVRNLDPNADNNPPATNFTKGAVKTYPTQAIVAAEVLQTFNAGSYNYIEIKPNPDYGNPFSTAADSLVLVSSTIIAPNDGRPQNDTLVAPQRFSTVMAYDDGSAESSYGITGTQPKRFAYEFNLNHPDTLVGFQIMYTQVDANVSDLVFNIYMWDSLKLNDFSFVDAPFATVDNRKPLYIDSINGFATYKLDSAIVIPRKMYLGWAQSETETRSLQVGFDLNSPLGRKHMFVYTNGTWHASTLNATGSPMIRLIFDTDYWGGGTAIKHLGEEAQLKVFPNPVNSFLHIQGELSAVYDVLIVNLMGQNVLSENGVRSGVQLNDLTDGIYLVVARNQLTGKVFRNKIIKASN